MRDVIRRNWRFWLVLAEVLLLTAFFAHYIGHRQSLADQRAERQRAAICAILANIPGQIPPEIARARGVFARPAHPADCQPIPRSRPKATPAPTVTVTSPPQHTVTVHPGPTVTHTARPSPHPSATPTKQPSPSPSPSRTCVLIVCT